MQFVRQKLIHKTKTCVSNAVRKTKTFFSDAVRKTKTYVVPHVVWGQKLIWYPMWYGA